MLDVMKDKCNECLFSESRIVRPGRMADIISECRKKQKYFICHKASMIGSRKEPMCRGFYDTQDTQLIQVATRLNMLRFVDEKDL